MGYVFDAECRSETHDGARCFQDEGVRLIDLSKPHQSVEVDTGCLRLIMMMILCMILI